MSESERGGGKEMPRTKQSPLGGWTSRLRACVGVRISLPLLSEQGENVKFQGLLPESQGQYLALTISWVSYSLESGVGGFSLGLASVSVWGLRSGSCMSVWLLRVAGFRSQVSGSGFRISGFGFRVSGCDAPILVSEDLIGEEFKSNTFMQRSLLHSMDFTSDIQAFV